MMTQWDEELKYVALILASSLVVSLGLYARRSVPEAPIPAPAPQTAFVTAAEALEHKRLLKKHGLDREIAVILEDPLGRYYIREGRRYKFQ